MQFTDWEFLFLFFPVCWAAFTILRRRSWFDAEWFFVLASGFFYALCGLAFIPYLLISLLVNVAVMRFAAKDEARRKVGLWVAVAFNILFLGLFKYKHFVLNDVLGMADHSSLIFPLGISFFTFQQISVAVDVYQRRINAPTIKEFSAFVLFFPKLISGPLARIEHVLPQLKAAASVDLSDMQWRGLVLFSIGFFKKAVLVPVYFDLVNPVYVSAARGTVLGVFDSWVAILAYALQIYFDFSAYSDMAIGAALMFGIMLPVNFLSPYKAASPQEFWHRWHVSLSEFLRDYLYIPLGGSHVSALRIYINLLITMALGGLWHGASWSFVIWGVLHGVFLAAHRASKDWKISLNWAPHMIKVFITFLIVSFLWVFFRAGSMMEVQSILEGAFGIHGWSMPVQAQSIGFLNFLPFIQWEVTPLGLVGVKAALWAIPFGLAFVWFLPNSNEILGIADNRARHKGGLEKFSMPGVVKPNRVYAWVFAALFVLSFLSLSAQTGFIYFEF